jgi:DNA modification methylase
VTNLPLVLHGDSREVLAQAPADYFDAVVCDPPYALVSINKRFSADNAAPIKAKEFTDADGKKQGVSPYMRAASGFMGQKWDTGETAFDPAFWFEVMRVMKPGAHLIAFGGTRSYHRLACAIEDAGFEVRDMLSWLYGSGFPKSHDVAKEIDKRGGVWRGQVTRALPNQSVAKGVEYERVPKGDPISEDARAWEGWGTALKPACEPMVLARKPLSEKTIVANVLKWGTGALNIDACRIEAEKLTGWGGSAGGTGEFTCSPGGKDGEPRPVQGRWPANVVHDGSDGVLDAFPSEEWRFFYNAKADVDDRAGSGHPTVKPVDLMRWCVRLITPKAGRVLDPFAGSGSTGEAAWREGFDCMLIEREERFVTDINRRIAMLTKSDRERATEIVKAKDKVDHAGPLFATEEA